MREKTTNINSFWFIVRQQMISQSSTKLLCAAGDSQSLNKGRNVLLQSFGGARIRPVNRITGRSSSTTSWTQAIGATVLDRYGTRSSGDQPRRLNEREEKEIDGERKRTSQNNTLDQESSQQNSSVLFNTAANGTAVELALRGYTWAGQLVHGIQRWWTQLEEERWRPMGALERARRFPNAMMALVVDDIVRYQTIIEAKNTAMNSWKVESEVASGRRTRLVGGGSKPLQALSKGERAHALSLLLPESREYHYGDGLDQLLSLTSKDHRMTHSTIMPWRQRQQQQQTIEDLSRLTPLILLWIPPILGFIPTILAIAAPQTFTRHFHNRYEVLQYSLIEEQQRRNEFTAVLGEGFGANSKELLERISHFFVSTPRGGENRTDQLAIAINDPIGLYETLFEFSSVFHRGRLAVCSSLDELPARYLQRLSVAMGTQSIGIPSVNQMMASVTPAPILRSQIRKGLFNLVESDALLLVEGHDQSKCESLTDQEVFDACLERNFPIALTGDIGKGPEVVNYNAMRRDLTDHMQYMASVHQHVLDKMLMRRNEQPSKERQDIHALSETSKERLGMFTVHIGILREHFKRQRN